jgi:hypothetical protein
LVPGPPKRLAQGVGLAFSATSLVLRLRGSKRAANGVLGMLIGAASLEAFWGICVACRAFPLLMRAGLVPQATCERCADLWSASPKAEDQPPALAERARIAEAEKGAGTLR